ncbi:MAG: hypothetical protein ABIP20_09125 [Chthoniobacteraceae bacterium]
MSSSLREALAFHQRFHFPARKGGRRCLNTGRFGQGCLLGSIADHTGIIAVFHGCGYLPLIGLLTVFLPDIESGGS